MMRSAMRSVLPAAVVAVALLVGCGGGGAQPPAQKPQVATDLAPVKGYLLDHTSRLKGDTAKLATQAGAYYALAKSQDFEYGRLLATPRDELARMVQEMQ